jgi:hypothetical protein
MTFIPGGIADKLLSTLPAWPPQLLAENVVTSQALQKKIDDRSMQTPC